MRFLEVRLDAPAACVPALADFYGRLLGFDERESAPERLVLGVGETALEFAASSSEAFYHLALLVPGDRFAAALDWARARTALLPHARSPGVVFDFPAWHAQACYFHDPAGSIVELIAHGGIGETGARGEFRAAELLGLSELGLVGEPPALANGLAGVGLELWDGTIDEPGQLAFVGEQARTLILAPPGRGWLPTGRPSEQHSVQALISGPPQGEVELDAGRYRIRRS